MFPTLMPRVLIWFCLAAIFVFGQDPPSAGVPLRLIVVNSAAEAEAIAQRLKSGADFAVLAREKSVDATSVDGGLLGTVDPATLRAELRTALQGLGAGQVSGVFRLPSGFAIVKVLPASEMAEMESV